MLKDNEELIREAVRTDLDKGAFNVSFEEVSGGQEGCKAKTVSSSRYGTRLTSLWWDSMLSFKFMSGSRVLPL